MRERLSHLAHRVLRQDVLFGFIAGLLALLALGFGVAAAMPGLFVPASGEAPANGEQAALPALPQIVGGPTLPPTWTPTFTHTPPAAPSATRAPALPPGGTPLATFTPRDTVTPASTQRPTSAPVAGCPTTSNNYYSGLVPIIPPQTSIPAHLNAEMNLGLIGYAPTSAQLNFVDYGGYHSDELAPQFDTFFQPSRLPPFTAAYRVYKWNTDPAACGGQAYGCRGELDDVWPVTLLALGTNDGETLLAPARGPEIYEGGYVAMVLYADETRLTLSYTREDSIVYGYALFVEDICVDPNLLATYRGLIGSDGRRLNDFLPALRSGDPLGTADGDSMKIAVRDTGTFIDPRSIWDWWQAYR